MGSDVGDVSDPGLIGLIHLELTLQVVWRDHRGLTASQSRPAAVARLRSQTFDLEQPRHAMLAATLTQVAHVQRELAVAVDTATLQPCLLEQAQKSLIVLGPWTLRRCLPRIVAAGM